MEAASKANVKRLVYISSTAVYGFWPPTGPVTEETPTRYTGNGYGDGKIDSEQVALTYYRDRGLPVTILRPSLVYGPFETFWAAHLIRCLSGNWMTLINGGTGICNSLYIDNLISAIWLAAQTDAAVGQTFIVSDGEKVTWKQMIEGHAAAMKNCRLPLPDATIEEIAAARSYDAKCHNPSSLRATVRLLRRPETREALRSVPVIATAEKMARGVLERFPNGIRAVMKRAKSNSTGQSNGATAPVPATLPVIPLSEHDTRLYTCDVAFSIEKARNLLGYEPKVDFAEGIRRTAEWIKWMKL
jgi:nucleoside-diphosphate-sugar epimerase